MPRPYPPEFRFRAAALVRAGKPITIAAMELGISPAVLHRWVCQDQVDRGERPGLTTTEPAQLPKANKRIRQLVPADSDGFVQLLSRAESLGQRVPFGIAGTDSYGGALTPFVRRRSYRLPDRIDGYAGW